VKQDFPEGVPRRITCNGRRDAVERAVRMISDLIAGGSSTQDIVRRHGMGASRALSCPKALIGKLIGKQGETIKGLQRASGASIQARARALRCGCLWSCVRRSRPRGGAEPPAVPSARRRDGAPPSDAAAAASLPPNLHPTTHENPQAHRSTSPPTPATSPSPAAPAP